MNNSNRFHARGYAKRALGVAAVAGVAGLVVSPIHAMAAGSNDDATSVSEVHVEGKRMRVSPKITAPLLDTPKTVSVITADTLRDAGIFSLADAFRTLPGITLESGRGALRSVTVRAFAALSPPATSSSMASAMLAASRATCSALSRSKLSKAPDRPLPAVAPRAGASIW